MVKLYHVGVLYKNQSKAVCLCAASDLSSFGFFQRNSIKEFMNFTSQILVERCQPGSRMSVKEEAYMCHIFVKADNLAAALISDQEYPQRVAHTLLNKILQEFSSIHSPSSWTGGAKLVKIKFLHLVFLYKKDPRKADSLMKIQDELDETKIILHNTVQAVLERGEKLDDLVVKSEELSLQSKTFYKTARKTNQCCVIL
ncbi:unnamed protein product [Larinioides sclopetarius]|uniref:Uncharacterized protein n=1 Tax=Larinioides sclopetarius TaxID=280406 RepID=A0AAV2B637_9ARAC